jgi:hypothetical protein
MAIPWVDEQIPQAVGKYKKTSEPDEFNNCIAYAAGVFDEWWQHTPGYKWHAFRSESIESLVALFANLGYERCDSGEVETGYEKVVLYERGRLWTHAARQLPDGKWTSKLGPDEDIRHDSADCICGAKYGTVYCYMRRPNEAKEE